MGGTEETAGVQFQQVVGGKSPMSALEDVSRCALHVDVYVYPLPALPRNIWPGAPAAQPRRNNCLWCPPWALQAAFKLAQQPSPLFFSLFALSSLALLPPTMYTPRPLPAPFTCPHLGCTTPLPVKRYTRNQEADKCFPISSNW